MTQSAQPLTVKEAAQFLAVSEFTLKRYARENLIPSIKQGKEFVFELDAVENYKEMADKINKGPH